MGFRRLSDREVIARIPTSNDTPKWLAEHGDKSNCCLTWPQLVGLLLRSTLVRKANARWKSWQRLSCVDGLARFETFWPPKSSLVSDGHPRRKKSPSSIFFYFKKVEPRVISDGHIAIFFGNIEPSAVLATGTGSHVELLEVHYKSSQVSDTQISQDIKVLKRPQSSRFASLPWKSQQKFFFFFLWSYHSGSSPSTIKPRHVFEKISTEYCLWPLQKAFQKGH